MMRAIAFEKYDMPTNGICVMVGIFLIRLISMALVHWVIGAVSALSVPKLQL